jgi:transposase
MPKNNRAKPIKPYCVAGEVIYRGTASIGKFLGKSKRQAEYLCATAQVPAFKEAGQWCLRERAYLQHIEAMERRTLAAPAAIPCDAQQLLADQS